MQLCCWRSVAQLAEHRSPKPGVVGSSPSTPAMCEGISVSGGVLCGNVVDIC